MKALCFILLLFLPVFFGFCGEPLDFRRATIQAGTEVGSVDAGKSMRTSSLNEFSLPKDDDGKINISYGYQFLANSERQQSKFSDDGHVFLQLGSNWAISEKWNLRPAVYFQRSLVTSTNETEQTMPSADVEAILEADVVVLGLSPKYTLLSREDEEGLEAYVSTEFLGYHVFGDEADNTNADYYYEAALGFGANLNTEHTFSNISAAFQYSDRFEESERYRLNFLTAYSLAGIGYEDAGRIFMRVGANISAEDTDEVETSLMLGVQREAPDVFKAIGGLLGLTKSDGNKDDE